MRQRCDKTVPRAVFFLLLISVSVFLVYRPGLHGPFVFDDTTNIVHNPAVAISNLSYQDLQKAASSSDSGVLKRPLAMLSFALNHYFSGSYQDTFPYKVTNLVIHLINTVLVYWLSFLLLQQNRAYSRVEMAFDKWLPAFISAAWALHPLNLTTVLYTVQRMTSLAALFVLIGLITFIYGRQRIEQQRPHGFIVMGTGLYAGLIFGLLSKENAALLPLFILVIEYVFFDYSNLRRLQQSGLKRFYFFSVIAPLALIFIWLIARPDFILSTYAGRDFNITQRLLTEPRILWFYISLVFIPDITKLSLFHDDIPISTGLFAPWTTSIAWIGLIIALVLAIKNKQKHPIFSFAVLWFLVGHSMESGFIGLEIAQEHRNYLPMLGLLMAAMYGLFALLNNYSARIGLPMILGLALIAGVGLVTHLQAETWSSESEIIQFMAKYHPESASSHAMLAEWYAHNDKPLQALEHYKVAATLAPDEASYLIEAAMFAAKVTLQDPSYAKLPLADKTYGKNNLKIKSGTQPISTVIPEFIVTHESGNETKLMLNSKISQKIENLLEQRSPSPFTLLTLGSLSTCISQQPHYCRAVYPEAVRWYQAILRNTSVTGVARKNSIIYFFDIAMWHDDYKLALETAKDGTISDPSDSTYSLMQANAYISLNQTDEAKKIILSVKRAGNDMSPDDVKSADALLSLIRQKRNAIQH